MASPEPAAKRACAGCQAVVGAGGGAVDRLSGLPDGLLHAVLSFIPAPQVVRTCVLSRRWRRLWRSAPRVNIDQKDFGITVSSNSARELEERWVAFEDFATNLLMFHDTASLLSEFRFSSHLYNPRHVDRWIRRGIEFCPAVLKIAIFSFSDHGTFKIPPVADTSFHRLKTLDLWDVYLDSHFTDLLCSGCPVLEDLKFSGCRFCGNRSQGISSRTLNKLVMEGCVNSTGHPLVITAPSLAYLCLQFGSYKDGILLAKMDSLVEATIYVDSDYTLSWENQRELLGSLFNVTTLELFGFQTEELMLSDRSDKFPIFSNLQDLWLSNCFLDDYDLNDKLDALGTFLHNAPCLLKLTLDSCMFHSFADSEWEIERKNITLQHQNKKAFQCHKLKVVKIVYEYDHDHQLIEVLWSLRRSLPDVNIELTKND